MSLRQNRIHARPFTFLMLSDPFGGVLTDISAPVSIELTLTHKCNHRCIHCYNPSADHPDLKKSGLPVSERIARITEQLVENNVRKVILSGGEPLTEKGLLLSVMRSLQAADIIFSLNTNLTLIDPSFLSDLTSLEKVPSLFVSLPSVTEEACDAITGIKGSYRRILDGLKICCDHNVDVALNIVVSKKTQYSYEGIRSLPETYPCITHVSLSQVVAPVHDPDNPDFYLDEDDYHRRTDVLRKIYRDHGISSGDSIPLPLCITGYDDEIRQYSSMCCAGRTHCTIDFDTGQIHACSHDTESFGNIYTDGLN